MAWTGPNILCHKSLCQIGKTRLPLCVPDAVTPQAGLICPVLKISRDNEGAHMTLSGAQTHALTLEIWVVKLDETRDFRSTSRGRVLFNVGCFEDQYVQESKTAMLMTGGRTGSSGIEMAPALCGTLKTYPVMTSKFRYFGVKQPRKASKCHCKTYPRSLTHCWPFEKSVTNIGSKT